jgi:steroid delta-isomerase-like uncharacterized protein
VSEQNKQITRRFYDEVINQGNLNLIDELVADDFVEHEAFPGLSSDKAGVRAFFELFRSAFPDLRMQVEDMIAEGDRVAARCRMTGSHRGEFLELPATGKRFDIQVIDLIRFQDGKAVEHWGATDQVSLMQQLGALPQ